MRTRVSIDLTATERRLNTSSSYRFFEGESRWFHNVKCSRHYSSCGCADADATEPLSPTFILRYLMVYSIMERREVATRFF